MLINSTLLARYDALSEVIGITQVAIIIIIIDAKLFFKKNILVCYEKLLSMYER